jgi:hypothetical protein
MSIEAKATVQEIDAGKLRETLKGRRQVLEWTGPIKKPARK